MVCTFNILSEVSPLWGICPFEKVQNNLIECRAKSRLPKSPKSIIIFALPYLLPSEKYKDLNVSKYSVVKDYHIVFTERLEKAAAELKKIYPSEEFAYFSDNSPIPEVYCAVQAGLGVKGENSLLITEKYGSFVFLGEIVTSLTLDGNNSIGRFCIKCGKCTRCCPTKAIENGTINKDKCLSHITQKKGELTDEEKRLIKSTGCTWGCDICQNICPLNKNAATTDIPDFLNSPISHVDPSTPIEGRAFAWRGEKVIKRNIDILDKNL